MGWGRWLLMGNLGQQMDLSDHATQIENQEERILCLESQLAEQASGIEGTEASLIQLQIENDQLKLFLEAVMRILTEKGLTSEKEMKRLVELIDVEEGSTKRRMIADVFKLD